MSRGIRTLLLSLGIVLFSSLGIYSGWKLFGIAMEGMRNPSPGVWGTAETGNNGSGAAVNSNSESRPNLEIDPNAGAVTPAPTQITEGIKIPGLDTLTIGAYETQVDVTLDNPAENSLYYLTFELRLMNTDGSYSVLYKSGLVPPGQAIRQITLNQGLAQNEYSNCVMHVQPYYISDYSETNSADIQFTLDVV